MRGIYTSIYLIIALFVFAVDLICHPLKNIDGENSGSDGNAGKPLK